MKKITILIALVILLLSFTHSQVIAAPINDECQTNAGCPRDYQCQQDASGSLKCVYIGSASNPIQDIFGTIQPPDVLKGLLKKDPTGAGAISQFLSNFVVLIFTLAMVVFVFMILWGAFDWLMSEGDKEKISSAQKKIINAVIGIMLFALAFAIIRILGTVTGFTFFKAVNP